MIQINVLHFVTCFERLVAAWVRPFRGSIIGELLGYREISNSVAFFFEMNVTGGAMTATENIFLAWALFSGGVTLFVAILIIIFNATKYGRVQ